VASHSDRRCQETQLQEGQSPEQSEEQEGQSPEQSEKPYPKKKLLRQRGGFDAAIMGQFVANATTAIIPLASYTAYKWWKSEKKTKKSRKP